MALGLPLDHQILPLKKMVIVHCSLQLDHVQLAAQALFPLITCRSSCNKLKNSLSFLRGNAHDINGPDDGDGVGLGL